MVMDKHEPVWVVFTSDGAEPHSLEIFTRFQNAWQELDLRIMSHLANHSDWREQNIDSLTYPAGICPDKTTLYLFSVSAPVWVDLDRIEDYLKAHVDWVNAADTDSITAVSIGRGSLFRRA
jgi:hypothetical protein